MYSHYPISPSPYPPVYSSANSSTPSLSLSLSASAAIQPNGVSAHSQSYNHAHYAAYHAHPPSPVPYSQLSKGFGLSHQLPPHQSGVSVPVTVPTQGNGVPSDIQSGADALFQVANTRKRLRNESDDSSSSGGSGNSQGQTHSPQPQPAPSNAAAYRTRATASAYSPNGHGHGQEYAGYMDAELNGGGLSGEGYANDYSMKLARRGHDAMNKYGQTSNTLLPPSPQTLHPNMNVHMHMQVPRAVTNSGSYVYSTNAALPLHHSPIHVLHNQISAGSPARAHSPLHSSPAVHAHSLSYSSNATSPTPSVSAGSSSVPSASALVGGSSNSSLTGNPSPTISSRVSPSVGHTYRDDEKKRKHQETDRQRRQKIKDGMEALRMFVDHDASLKADQATIVGRSVDLIKEMKGEIATLRKKLMENETTQTQGVSMASTHGKSGDEHHADQSSNASEENKESVLTSRKPLQNYQVYDAILSGIGVAFFRTSCSGRIIDVNSIFQQISGFTAANLLGTIVCLAPLNVTLSIMPASITRLFSSVAEHGNPSAPNTPAGSHPGNSDNVKSAPLFTINLSSLPAIPDSELVPYCENEKMLKDVVVGYGVAHEEALAASATAEPSSTSASGSSSSSTASEKSDEFGRLPCVHPKPNGAFLLNHLSKLPPSSVLKLFSRHDTANGDIIEAVIAIQLVRSEDGKPDHMIVMSTPDCRRLIKRPVEQSTN